MTTNDRRYLRLARMNGVDVPDDLVAYGPGPLPEPYPVPVGSNDHTPEPTAYVAAGHRLTYTPAADDGSPGWDLLLIGALALLGWGVAGGAILAVAWLGSR